ncbi:hypothetical protein EPUL_004325, partial [Erysiphe pulchra]
MLTGIGSLRGVIKVRLRVRGRWGILLSSLKLRQIRLDVEKRYVFGVNTGSVYTIENQKRGLLHAPILLFLHRDVVSRCAEQVDELVLAQVFDPELAAIVKNLFSSWSLRSGIPNAPYMYNMQHRLRSSLHDEICLQVQEILDLPPSLKGLCMRDGKRRKGFPKRFYEQTTMVENSFPEYERPDYGVRWGTERFMFDNRWVIPYNPYLTKKCKAYINMKITTCGVRSIKYLVKYLHKESDRATLQAQGQHDEIDMTLQG